MKQDQYGKMMSALPQNQKQGNANQQNGCKLDYWAKRSKQFIDTWLISFPALKSDV
jgi:hypothetical protein